MKKGDKSSGPSGFQDASLIEALFKRKFLIDSTTTTLTGSAIVVLFICIFINININEFFRCMNQRVQIEFENIFGSAL